MNTNSTVAVLSLFYKFKIISLPYQDIVWLDVSMEDVASFE